MKMVGIINSLLLSLALLTSLVLPRIASAERQIWVSERYSDPIYSPDGKSMLVQAFVPPRNDEIFLLSADGAEVRNLTQHPASDSSPRWSPDGRAILFFSDRDGSEEMFRMNADGSDIARIPGQASALGTLSCSPDGKSILFESKEGITMAAVDGSQPCVLARHGQGPIWSPDGRWILYWIFPLWEMRVVSVDGSEDHRIGEGNPITWTPDSKAVFYVSKWEGQGKPRHVHRINIDGSDARMVLENVQLSGSIADAHRLWSPDGLRLALAVEPSVGGWHRAGIFILDHNGRIERDFRKVEWFLYDSTVSWRDSQTLAFSRLYLSPWIEWKLPKDSGGVYLLNTHSGDISHVLRNKSIWIDPHNPPW